MLEEFMNVMVENDLDTLAEEQKYAEVKNIIDGLEMFSNDKKMLTNAYTDIFLDDNVVYLLTRISQHPIFMQHFPEFYEKNENGECVINCQQNSPYHRYGVFRHILYTVEYVGKDNLKYSRAELKILKWAMFLHDIGKPFVKTTNLEGKDSFSGHDDMSVELASSILERFEFPEDEKNIILCLIKYHDRYLNEGELTYDNLSFLAEELGNQKELFELLIEVKTADNRAKSREVYNKFLAVVTKYVDFANEYFSSLETDVEFTIGDENEGAFEFSIDDEEIIGSNQESTITEIPEEEVKVNNVESKHLDNKTLDKEDFGAIYQDVLHGRELRYSYIPVINIRDKKIYGYEIKARLLNGYNVHEFLKIAKEEGKYEKICQLILLNSLDKGILAKKSRKETLIARVDMRSFEKYNNKTRIYDIADKDNILILLENYDYSNSTDINNMCNELKKKHGRIGLGNFQNSKLTVNDLMVLNIDFIECNSNKKNDDLEDVVEFCSNNVQHIIMSHVSDEATAKELAQMDVVYMSGDVLIKENDIPEFTDYEVEKLVENI